MRRGLRVIGGVLLWPVLGFCMINVHELGHTAAAWLAGDHGAYYALYERYPNGSLNCIGCNHFDPRRLDWWGRVANAAAGVAATQLVFWCLVVLARPRSRNVRACLFVVFVLGDAVWQTQQALRASIAAQRSLTNVDFADLLWLLHQRVALSVTALKLALAGACVVYVVLAAGVLLALGRPRWHASPVR